MRSGAADRRQGRLDQLYLPFVFVYFRLYFFRYWSLLLVQRLVSEFNTLYDAVWLESYVPTVTHENIWIPAIENFYMCIMCAI